MSFDLQVWSVLPLRDTAFEQAERWQQQSGSWTHSRKNWQIVVTASDKVLPEDIPDEAAQLLPGIQYLTHLNLEGKSTEEAVKLAQSTANEIARKAHGAVFDPQEDSWRLPSGVKRFSAKKNEESFDVVALSWWFLESPLLERNGREVFVTLLERMLPEALPKRYGLWEPPQHIYAETGKSHLLQFLDDNLHDTIVWYPHRPIAEIYLGFPSPMGAHKLGFRTNHVSIEVEVKALSQPGWAVNLRQFWQKASALIRPIYGDVRFLGGYCRSGATVFGVAGYEGHPVRSWWWTGIPRNLGSGVVLGDVYQKLWPGFMPAATVLDGLAFTYSADWSSEQDLRAIVGEPPEDQRQPETGAGRDAQSNVLSPRGYRYPAGWPFGEPSLRKS
jgi:hypothetical protein